MEQPIERDAESKEEEKVIETAGKITGVSHIKIVKDPKTGKEVVFAFKTPGKGCPICGDKDAETRHSPFYAKNCCVHCHIKASQASSEGTT